jgi:hypothetical protein
MTLLNSGQYTSKYIPDTASDVCRITLDCCKNVHGKNRINKAGNVLVT